MNSQQRNEALDSENRVLRQRAADDAKNRALSKTRKLQQLRRSRGKKTRDVRKFLKHKINAEK